MQKIKKLLILSTLALSLAITACGKDKAQETEKVEVTEPATQAADAEVSAELSDWDGEWNSMTAYIDDAEVVEVLQEEADEHGETLDEVKAEKTEGGKTEFGGLLVDGNKVTFYEGKVQDNKVLAEAEYEFSESSPMEHGGHTMYWFIFENKGEQGPKYLAMMDVHGEDTMAHYHMRYLDDIADLDKDDHWYPTYLRASTTSEEAAEIFGHSHDHDHEHDHGHSH